MPKSIQFIPDFSNKILSVVSVLTNQNNWGISFIGADLAWPYSKGEDVTVAVIDTGWTNHKDLLSNFKAGYDATGNNDFIDRGNFHGTHVAGIIASNCGDGNGTIGIAPMAKLVPIKALNDDGSGSFDFVINALKIALDIDVDIINMSLGTTIAPNNDEVHNLIKQLTDKGKIVICAAGNDGGEVNFPARYDESVAVAAVEHTGTLAKFSSRGPELDTAAPGVQIYSTWGDGRYIMLDGTSMACPCISGVVALIVSWYKKHPELNFEINQQNITKLLHSLGDDSGQNIIQAGQYNIGVPKFCNFNWGGPIA